MLTGIIPGHLKISQGEASLPEGGGHRIVVNLVTDSGQWGDFDFHESLAQRWPQAATEYRRGYYAQRYFKPGMIQEIGVRSDVTIVNLILNQEEPFEESLKEGVKKVSELALDNKSSVHITKDHLWNLMEPLIEEHLIKKGLNVTVYQGVNETSG